MSILRAILTISMGAALMTSVYAAELPSGKYDLVSLGETKLPTDPTPFVMIDGTRINGHSLCNTFSGQITWNADGSVEPGMPLRGTMMVCADAERQELDARLMAALGQIERFDVDGRRLVLTTQAGEIVGLKTSDQ